MALLFPVILFWVGGVVGWGGLGFGWFLGWWGGGLGLVFCGFLLVCVIFGYYLFLKNKFFFHVFNNQFFLVCHLQP
ncbi:hypothetical protein ACQWKP_22960, partial [Salmonella enterica subsp. enterica serovar Infantis]